MFKVICDVKLLPSNSWHDDFPNHNIAHAALKYGRIIGYNNCTACDIGSLKLTSASDVPRHSEMLTLIKRWSINILNPANINYHSTYHDILEEAANHSFDVSNLRFIGIFEKDISVDQRVGETVFTQVYEAIIDINSPKSMYEVYNTSSSPRAHIAYTTGYETYHQKTHFISADARKDIVFTDTIFQTTEDGRKYVYTSIIAYLLRGQDALNCKMLNFKRKIYDIDLYMHFFKKDAIEKLKIEIALFRADYSLCDVTGKGDYIPLHYAPKALAKSTLDQCRAIGGKQISAKTTIEMICKIFNSEHALGAYISGAFKMTCANYHSFIHFDTMGEIIGLKMSHHDILKQYAIEHYEF